MRKKALRKDFYMEIRKSLNRFISIFLIVALGVAFYSGIQSAAPDMRYSGDAYFDEHKLMDLKVVGTLGLTEADVEAIRGVQGIAKAEPGYMEDVLCGSGESQKALHVESVSPTLNQLTAEEGRLPQKAGECFVDIEFLNENHYRIGDEITFYLPDGDELLMKRDAYTIVGAGSSPLYISFHRGNTTLGSGEIEGAAYILPEDFDSEVYTQVYMEVGGARDLVAYTDAYDRLIETVLSRVEAIAGERCELRYAEVRKKAGDELGDGQQEFAEGRQEAYTKLADARREIGEGEEELYEGARELLDGKKELADGEKELAENEKTLAEKEQEYEDGMKQLADGKAEFAANEQTFNRQYASGMKEVTSGEKQLKKAKKELKDGKKTYQSNLQQYNASKSQYDAGEAAYAQGLAQFQEQQAALPGMLAQLDAQRAQLVQNETALADALSTIRTQQAQTQQQYDAVKGQAEADRTALPGLQAELAALQGAQSAKQNEIDAWTGERATLAQQLEEQKHLEDVDPEAIKELEAGIAQLDTNIAAHQTEMAGRAAAMAEKQQQIEACGARIGTAQALEQGLAALQAELEKQSGTLAQVQAGIAQIDSGKAEAQKQISEGEKTLAGTRTQLDAAKQELTAAKPQLDAAKTEIEKGEKEIAANEKKLSSARAQLANGKQQIEAARQTIAENEKTLADGKKQLDEGKEKIADAKKEIADAKKEIADGEKELEDGKKELMKARWDYADGRAEAYGELKDAKIELAEARDDVAAIKEAEWMVDDRSTLPENIGYGENADRMRSIGRVFPVLFFLVAALISLTTMTRMVEEERTQIGTLKALGYGKFSIASKYLSYALLATLGGSVAGILIGEKILPFIIVTAYKILYHHIPNVELPYNLEHGLVATLAALFCTLAATFAACNKELAATPAVLMRPPAPKQGKRVLLEYVPFLWKPLSFSWKSTVRNLFRYKKRFLMTVIGISGCMGLMIVGYGLRDSISSIADLQFDELQRYDGMVILDEDAAKWETAKLTAQIASHEQVQNSMEALMETVEVSYGKKTWSPYILVPKDVERAGEFFAFRDRESKETYALTDEGAVITEKIARMLNVSAGDVLQAEKEGIGTIEIPIAAVTENYLSHYIYMTPAFYEKCLGEEVKYDEILFQAKEKEDAQTIGEEFMRSKAALSISYTVSLKAQLDDMLQALDIVIIALIISAGMLAFVVLYNLNNININERRRELATLKVLGFYDKEVSAYVYRENILVTIIGVLAGVGLGKLLHGFTITTVEVDSCMFGRYISVESFCICAGFTAGFSILVNLVMHYKLKKIDMVESLKSVE